MRENHAGKDLFEYIVHHNIFLLFNNIILLNPICKYLEWSLHPDDKTDTENYGYWYKQL